MLQGDCVEVFQASLLAVLSIAFLFEKPSDATFPGNAFV